MRPWSSLIPSDALWSWQLRAHRREEDPAIFFPVDGERGKSLRRRQQQAKAICAQCDVIRECLNHSIVTTSGSGSGADWPNMNVRIYSAAMLQTHRPAPRNSDHGGRRPDDGDGRPRRPRSPGTVVGRANAPHIGRR
jgi:WhiB family redox-sensing transcriptional regulator